MAYYGNFPQGLIYSNVGSSGGMLQLSACGTMTALLTAEPTLTYWRYRYLQYTNFAMISVVQPLEPSSAFGGQTQTKISKVGDLMYFMYIVIALPGIRACPPRQGGCGPTQQFPYSQDGNNPCAQTDAAYFATLNGGYSSWAQQQYGSCGDWVTDCGAGGCSTGGGSCPSEPFAYWTNAIGQFLIQKAQFMVGSQIIDTMYNDYLYMWEELAGKPGKRLTEMVGKYYCQEDLIAFAQQARIMYVPMYFYFTQAAGQAFPFASVGLTSVSLNVKFAPLQNCVIVSGPDVQVVKCSGGGGVLQDGDLDASLETCQIILDLLERDRFASTYFEQLITQVTPLYQCVCCQNYRLNLNFAYTSIEFIFAVRRACNEKANNWFNYSGIMGKEPLIAAGILFDTQERQSMRNANWYRLVQPYQFHTLIPDACIYDYSFSLYPEEAQPSGGATLTRLENVALILEFQEGLDHENVTVIVFSRSYNLLKFRNASAGLTFGS